MVFYSKYVFVTKGKLAPVWLAANWDKKLTKKEVSEISVDDSVKDIIEPQQPLALRLSGKLLMGVVKLWQRKMGYLHDDCTEALHRLKKKPNNAKKRGRNQLQNGQSNADPNLVNGSSGNAKKRKSATLIPIDQDSLNMFSQFAGGSNLTVEQVQHFLAEGEDDEFDANIMNSDDLLMSADTSVSYNLSSNKEDSTIDQSLLLMDDDTDNTLANQDLLSQPGDNDPQHDDDEDPLGANSSLLGMDDQGDMAGFTNGLLMNVILDDEKSKAAEKSHNSSIEKGQNLSRDPSHHLSGDDLNSDLSDGGGGLPSDDDLDPGMDMDPRRANLSAGSTGLLRLGDNNSIGSASLLDPSLDASGVPMNNADLSPHPMPPIEEQKAPPPKKKRKKRKRRVPPKIDKITELANEIISAQLKDTSDITYDKRPSADLRPVLHPELCDPALFASKDALEALVLFKPMLFDYAPELMEGYEQDARRAFKRRRLALPRSKPKRNSDTSNRAGGESPDPFAGLDNSSRQGTPNFSDDDDPGFGGGFSDDDLPNSSNPYGGGSLGDVSDLLGVSGGSSLNVSNDPSSLADSSRPEGDGMDEDDEFQNPDEGDDAGEDNNSGWSSRTQKILRYLNTKDDKEFCYQDLIQGKARKTAVGLVYELLVLKTHDHIEIDQQKPYGQIKFSLKERS